MSLVADHNTPTVNMAPIHQSSIMALPSGLVMAFRTKRLKLCRTYQEMTIDIIYHFIPFDAVEMVYHDILALALGP